MDTGGKVSGNGVRGLRRKCEKYKVELTIFKKRTVWNDSYSGVDIVKWFVGLKCEGWEDVAPVAGNLTSYALKAILPVDRPRYCVCGALRFLDFSSLVGWFLYSTLRNFHWCDNLNGGIPRIDQRFENKDVLCNIQWRYQIMNIFACQWMHCKGYNIIYHGWTATRCEPW